MASPQQRSKAYGYATEKAALEALRSVFPGLRRVGSVGYSKSHPDLIQEGRYPQSWLLRLIITRDKGRPMLATLAVDDLVALLRGHYLPELTKNIRVAAQVKGRARTFLGSLYDELKASTR